MNGLISIRHLFAILGCALLASACTEANGQKDNTTAVHSAETASGTLEEMMAYGKKVYEGNCAACHQADGSGLAGAFPPLAESDYLRGDRENVLAVALSFVTAKTRRGIVVPLVAWALLIAGFAVLTFSFETP